MTELPSRWYSRPGIWFWVVITLGAALRFYLVVLTEGTQDVAIWERHARDVRDHGLIGYYHGDPWANHPPFISKVESLLLCAADATGIPFRIFLRAPFALLDAGTTFLLLLLLGGCRWRFVAAAAYWLNPLSAIFSAYHGNTDSAVAFFLVLCVWLLSKDKLLAAAVALGVSLWIKLPTVLAIPALVLFIPDWRRRVQFLLIAGVVALATYVPALIQDPAIVWKNVFGYRPNLAHDRWRASRGTTRAFIFDHRCSAKLARAAASAGCVSFSKRLANRRGACACDHMAASFQAKCGGALCHDCRHLHRGARIERRLFFPIFCLVAAVLVLFPTLVLHSCDYSRRRIHLFFVLVSVRQPLVDR